MKEAIITSSILIICMILLRQLCKGKISACLQYALWLIVAVRLIVPAITAVFPNLLPQSEISIMNVAEKVEISAQDYIQLPEQIGQINLPIGALPYVRTIYSDGPTSVFVAGRIGFTWIDFFMGTWYAGIAIIGIWMITVNILFMRKLHRNRVKHEKDDYKLPIYYAKELSSPCLYGFPGRQVVYLPEEIADDEEKVKHILAHEYCHYKHKDVFWAGLRCVLMAVYWFNPLVWIAAILSKRDCELACDESAIKMLGEEERIAYGKTLLSLITKRTKASDIVCTATTMTGTGKGIKERIKRIAEKPHRLVIILIPVLVAVGALVAFTFTQAKEPEKVTVMLDGGGEQTVTTDSFQITIPETISNKIYCVTENDTDVIIYHKDYDLEIGRFCKLLYGDAMALADERAIIAIGDYGNNQALRRYMNGEIITHTYYGNEDTASREADGYSGFIPAPEDVDYEAIHLPYDENTDYSGTKVTKGEVVVSGTDNMDGSYVPNEVNSDAASENEVTVSYHDYLPNEELITTPTDGKIEEGITHDYKPTEYPNEGVAGVDAANSNTTASNSTDITYTFSDSTDTILHEAESSIIYLPDEELKTVAIPEEELWCYIYVPADYSDVDADIRGELAVINMELIDLCDSVTILSMSMESIEEILDDIIKNRVADVSKTDNISQIAEIAQRLPLSAGLSYRSLELIIDKEPYTATVHTNLMVDDSNKIDDDPLFMNAVLMFALIENLDHCNFRMDDSIGKIRYSYDIKIEDFETVTVYYERAEMEELFGELYPCSATKEDLAELYNRVLDYLNEK